MEIGILTQPLTTNYGGILQNYAMQQVIKRLGHNATTIRIAHKWQNMTYREFLYQYPKYILAYFIQCIKGNGGEFPETIWKWEKRVVGMESFIANNIVTTPYVKGNEISMEDISKNGIDTLLVGSDQVWHAGLPYMINAYFCKFAKDSNIRRIAYSASFGFDRWRGTNEQTKEARDLIKQFGAVGVREEDGIEICRKTLGRNATWVLDPTMLLDIADYIKLCRHEKVRESSFVFAYILDMTEEKKNMAYRIAKKRGCDVVFLDVKRVQAQDSIEKWLSNFRDSQYVVTDSYHGTVFSLIFQKEFVCIYNAERGNSRMESLKKLTGLKDRFVDPSSEVNFSDINYKEVENRINSMKELSISFLRDALKD